MCAWKSVFGFTHLLVTMQDNHWHGDERGKILEMGMYPEVAFNSLGRRALFVGCLDFIQWVINFEFRVSKVFNETLFCGLAFGTFFF